MFGIDSSELAIIALVALLVIGPKDLPRVMRVVGQWMARARGMTRHVRAGFDTMMREAELEDMQKQWAAQNEAIMKASALPDLGIREALPDLSVPDLPADDWMRADTAPAPGTIGDPTAETPLPETPAPATPAPEKPRRRRAKAVDTAPDTAPDTATDTATDTAPDTAKTPPKARKPRRKPEPQPTDS